MSSDKVLEILNIFPEIKAHGWIAGGWGVDAIVGKQTREHNDVDIAIDVRDEGKIIEKFSTLSFAVVDDARPTRFVLKSTDGTEIDIHPVVFDNNGNGEQFVHGGKSFNYPKDCFTEGVINGHKVPCLTAEQLVRFHLGYKPLEKDKHNMQMLHDHLGLPIPESFQQVTQYEDINDLINQLKARIQEILGDKLVGLYLYGSLVTGDFDREISDIDLLAAVSSDIDNKEFNELKKMHSDFAVKNKEWDDRIEVQYLSLSGLKTFKSQTTKMGAISPGEPFHMVDAGKDWIVNWYIVQEKGIILFGPPPSMIIDYITKEEFINIVQNHTKSWLERVKHISKRRGAQAYVILTLCRAYYSIQYGEQVSKIKAAQWMKQQFPEWASLIQQALTWREEQWKNKAEDESIYLQTVKFVNDLVKKSELLH